MISAVVLTKNEEKNIVACLQTLSWCNEIVVIDDESTDQTVVLAQKHGAKVVSNRLENFSSQRNFALNLVKGDWVLFIDADERVSDALKREIQSGIATTGNIHGFYLKRQDTLWGKKLYYGETAHVRLLRLARKNPGKWTGDVHETWEVKGRKGLLANSLFHFPHQTITEFLSEVNHYSGIRAEELYSQKVRANIFTIIFYPKAKFIHNYFLRLGFLDGIPGLIVALMMSFHSFLVRGKLWFLWQKKSAT